MAKKKPVKVPFEPADVRRLAFVSDPRLHPDGDRLAYVLRRAHRKTAENRYTAEIRVIGVDGREGRTLTADGIDCADPVWSPDGSWLAFTSKRGKDDRPQLHLLPTAGGEARRLCSVKGGAGRILWSPDGSRIAFLSPTDPRPKPGKKAERPFADDVEDVTHPWWRVNGIGSFLRKRDHLFVVSLKGGKPVQVTDGDWSVQSFCWDAAGDRLVYSATPDPDDDWATVMRQDLFVVPARGGAAERLTDYQGHPDSEDGGALWAPTPLPGGDYLCMGSDKELSWASPVRLFRVDGASGEVEPLTDIDVSVGDAMNCDVRFGSRALPTWVDAAGTTAREVFQHRGAVRVGEVDLAGGGVDWLTPPDLSTLALDHTPDGSVAAEIRTDMASLPEIWVRSGAGKARKVTRHNDSLLARRRIYKAKEMSFEATDGATVEGWAMLPRRRAKGLPAVLQIHGGPKTAYGHAFMIEFQILAGAGIGVLFSNPRGSDGYGAEWAHSVFAGHYGERDYKDLMEFTDHCLAEDSGVDASRLGVCGGSYGGFMTNWIVGHTDRYKAGVTQRGICDFVSFFGTSDIGFFFGKVQVGGDPWEAPDKYREKSPLTYAPDMKTPLLIIHSEQDLRCPIGQADQLYTTLRRLGRRVEYVRFPDETHELSRSGAPNRRMERLRRIRKWFRREL